jgi:hypothetical protein
MWNLKVMWDIETRQVGMYLLDQVCEECGAVATAPTEIDACDYCQLMNINVMYVEDSKS